MRICTQHPIADGTTNNWDSTTYNKTEAVNEEEMNIDINYISTASTNQQNFYVNPAPQNSSWISGEGIQAVQVTAIAEKESGDPATTLSVGVRPPSSIDYASSATTIGTSYSKISEIWTVNPDSSLEWIPNDIEDGEFFIRRN